MKRIMSFVVGCLLIGSGSAHADGIGLQPDWTVHPEAGEWMVLAASYSCEEAKDLAYQLAHIVRTKHKTASYVFHYVNEERKRLREKWEQMRQMDPTGRMQEKTIRVDEHWGVLVGGFKDMEDAHEFLQEVRKWELPQLRLRSGKMPYDNEVMVDKKTGKLVRAPVNPFHSAMVVHNPTVKREKANREEDYSFLKKLNSEEEYNLLNSRKPWTLAIKQYNGLTMIKPVLGEKKGLLERLWPFSNDNQGEMLNAAAHNAHELAKTLRQLGFETYVLHTRASSIVTVGGFDSLEDPRIDQTRKQVLALVDQVRAANKNNHDPLQLFTNPLPMRVPQP
jgi:hypothetical protein